MAKDSTQTVCVDPTLAPGSTMVQTVGVQYLLRSSDFYVNPRNFTEVGMMSFKPLRRLVDPSGRPCALWWTFQTTSSSIVRLLGPGVQADLLSRSNITSGPGGSAVGSSPILAQLSWDATTALIDIGVGMRYSIIAETATMGLRIPSLAVLENRYINTGNPNGLINDTDEDAVVVDALITVGATCGLSPLGERLATLTRTYDPTETDLPPGQPIPDVLVAPIRVSGSAGDFVIPPRARRVQFSVAQASNIFSAANRVDFLSDQISRLVRRTANDGGVGGRLTPFIDVPQNASIISILGFTATEPVTATWELEL